MWLYVRYVVPANCCCNFSSYSKVMVGKNSFKMCNFMGVARFGETQTKFTAVHTDFDFQLPTFSMPSSTHQHESICVQATATFFEWHLLMHKFAIFRTTVLFISNQMMGEGQSDQLKEIHSELILPKREWKIVCETFCGKLGVKCQ